MIHLSPSHGFVGSCPGLFNFCACLTYANLSTGLYQVHKVHPQVWIALGSISIIGVCAIPVFSKDERPGHDLFSSEKPEVIREAQEAKRQEYRKLIQEQRALRKKLEEAEQN